MLDDDIIVIKKSHVCGQSIHGKRYSHRRTCDNDIHDPTIANKLQHRLIQQNSTCLVTPSSPEFLTPKHCQSQYASRRDEFTYSRERSSNINSLQLASCDWIHAWLGQYYSSMKLLAHNRAALYRASVAGIVLAQPSCRKRKHVSPKTSRIKTRRSCLE